MFADRTRWTGRLGAVAAMIVVGVMIAPIRTIFFLDETEPFRRWRRRRD